MKTLRYAAMALAVSGVFSLGAKAESTTNDWWNVDFQALAEYVPDQPDIGMTVLTNKDVEAAGALVTTQTWMSGVWYTLDGDETTVTNEYNPTNTYKAFGFDTCLKLDTQGNDLTWVPTNGVEDITWTPASPTPPNSYPTITNVATVIDADLYLVGSDSAPDVGDFDAAHDVQAAVYLKNETDEDSGETTNSVLCVYVWDATLNDGDGANTWQELKGVELEDNAWARVQVIVDHSKPSPEVKVYVNGTQMTARNGDADHWTAANFTTAADAKRVTSVSFRGTGAVDNFVGRYVETTYDSYNFTAQVYMNGSPVAEGSIGNVSRVAYAEAGEGKSVTFANFFQDDLSIEWPEDEDEDPIFHVSYYLSKIEFVNFATGVTRTFNYSYSNFRVVPETVDEDYVYLSSTGEPPYSFSVMAPTEGATADSTIVRIYFETVPAEGDFKLTASQNVGTAPPDQTFNVNTLAVDETTFTFAQALTDGGKSYILSTIQVGDTPAGIEAAPSGLNVVVTVPLSDQIAEGVYNVASATYVEGTLADGEELQGSRDGNVYTYTKYTPPVAIIIAGTVTNKYDSLRGAITNATAGDTIYLLRDDAASFTAEDPILDIDFAVTIDGGSNTLYGMTDYAAGLHEIRIGGSGNVTIKDLKMTEFGDTAPLSGSQMPIVTRSTYTGTLTLDGVTIDKFNRQALLLCGGNFLITNSVITGDTTKTSYFQSAIETYYAKGTVVDTTITGIGALDAGTNGEGDAWAAAVFTVNPLAGADGSITVKSGSYTGQFITAFNPGTIGAITLEGGTFVATVAAAEEAFLDESEGGSTLAISGGWFDREPDAKYIAEGLAAYEDAPGTDAPWTVRGQQVTVTWVITETASNMVQVAKGSQVAAYAGEDVVNGTKTFKFWSTDGTTEVEFPVTANANLTFIAVWEDAAVDPIAVDPGTSLTAADKTNGDLPIEVTADGFVVKFRSSQPNIVYQLVASDTVNPADWTACTPVGDPVTSSAAASAEATQLITLTAPMTDNVKFFKIKASVPAGN
jgi:hypothetical protein